MKYKPFKSRFERFKGHKKRKWKRTPAKDTAYRALLRDLGFTQEQNAYVMREHPPSE